MRLRCTIGSMHILSKRKVVLAGEEFDMEATKAASLVSSGYAVPVEDNVAEPNTEPVEGEVVEPVEPDKPKRSHRRR